MAFNRQFNVTNVLENIYPMLRKQILFSLVGSVNSMLISKADGIREQLDEDGYDIKKLSAADIEVLIEGPTTAPDYGKTTLDMRNLSRLAVDWRKMLRVDDTHKQASQPEAYRTGSLANTLQFQIGKQKMPTVNEAGVKGLKALGIELDKDTIEASLKIKQARAQAWADQKAQRVGEIEWVIDHVFDAAGIDPDADSYEVDYFERLTPETREFFAGKLLTAVGKCMQTAITNSLTFTTGDVLGLGDVPLIQGLVKELNEIMYITPEPKKERSVRRVPKDASQEAAVH